MSDRLRLFSERTPARLAIAAGLLACALAVSGCGSTIASLPAIGEPAEAQNRPAVQPDYPVLFGDRHSPEAKPGSAEEYAKPTSGAPRAKPMSAEERAKLQAELVTARDRAAAEKREQINQPQPR